MKKYLKVLPLLLVGGICSGQLVNDGGTIVIKPGAVLYVESDVTNNTVGANVGTITVEGTLEVQEDLTNNATITTAAGSLVRFSGTANSNFKSNGANIENLEMAKDHAASGTVTLVDSLSVLTNLNFVNSANGNRLILGTKDLILKAQATTITNAGSANYIAADGTGMVEKIVTQDASFVFPIGDAAEFSPVEVDYVSGNATYTNAKIRANVVDAKHPNVPADADDHLTRYWNINQSGIGAYAADLTATYVAADVVGGSAGDIMGASQADGAGGMAPADWTFSGSANAANEVAGSVTTSNTDFTGFNFFGRLRLKAFLQGAYNVGMGEMTTNLPTLGSFPLNSPYVDAPATVTTIPADVVDWVKIELRDPLTPGVPKTAKSGFIVKSGEIVDLDGSADFMIKDGLPTSVAAVFHRNHLPIRTIDAGIDVSLSVPVLHDFSTGLAQAHDNPLILSNEAMLDLGSGVFGMFRGNASGDILINIADLIQTKNASNPSQSDVYSYFDINMDKLVNIADLIMVKAVSNPSKTAHIN